MKIVKLNCIACGAPISIPDDITRFNCANCGSLLQLEHGEGYYTLKAAEKISDAIRQHSDANTRELHRSQLLQSLKQAEAKLMQTRQEQSILAAKPWTQYTPKIMNELIFQEWSNCEEYRHLQGELDTLTGPALEQNDLALQGQIGLLDHAIMILTQLSKDSIYCNLIDSMREEKALYQEYLRTLGKRLH